MKKFRKVLLGLSSLCLGFALAACGGNEDTPDKPIDPTPGEHTHDFGESWQKDNTKHWKVCECGEKSGEAEHTFTSVENPAATHVAKGTKTYTCSVCGYSYTEEVQALGHDANLEWTKDGTHHWQACSCGELLNKAEHTWDNGVVTTPATCQEKGVKTFTCTVCGATKTEEIALTEHEAQVVTSSTLKFAYEKLEGETYIPEFTEGKNGGLARLKAGISTEDGLVPEPTYQTKVYGQANGGSGDNAFLDTNVLKLGSSSASGELHLEFPEGMQIKKVILKAAGWSTNDKVTVNGIEQTCTVAMSKEYQYDSMVFELTENTNKIIIVSNKRVIISELIAECEPYTVIERSNEVAPTCTTEGSYDYKVLCKGCGAQIGELQHGTIPALGHNLGDLVAKVPATCVATGVDAHYVCARCNAWVAEDGVTVKAQDQFTLAIDSAAHKYTTEVAIPEVPATCNADGTKAHFVCELCEKWFDTEKAEHEASWFVITSAGGQHTLGSVVPGVPATCTTDGYTDYQECSVCHDKIGYEVIPALGHDYQPVAGADWLACSRQGCGLEVYCQLLKVTAVEDDMKVYLAGTKSGATVYAGAFGSNVYFSMVNNIADAMELTLKATETAGVYYIMNGGKYLNANTGGNAKLSWVDTAAEWKISFDDKGNAIITCSDDTSVAQTMRCNSSSSRFGNYKPTSCEVVQLYAYSYVEKIDITEITLNNLDNLPQNGFAVNYQYDPKISVLPENANSKWNCVIPTEAQQYFKWENGKLWCIDQPEEVKTFTIKFVSDKGDVEATLNVQLASVTKYEVVIGENDKAVIGGIEEGRYVAGTVFNFSVTPVSGYEITKVLVNNVELTGSNAQYIITLSEDVTITVVTQQLQSGDDGDDPITPVVITSTASIAIIHEGGDSSSGINGQVKAENYSTTGTIIKSLSGDAKTYLGKDNSLKLGASGATGTITIELTGEKNILKVNVNCMTYNTDTGTFNCTVGGTTLKIDKPTTKSDISFDFEEGVKASSFTIATSAKRGYIYSIEIIYE